MVVGGGRAGGRPSRALALGREAAITSRNTRAWLLGPCASQRPAPLTSPTAYIQPRGRPVAPHARSTRSGRLARCDRPSRPTRTTAGCGGRPRPDLVGLDRGARRPRCKPSPRRRNRALDPRDGGGRRRTSMPWASMKPGQHSHRERLHAREEAVAVDDDVVCSAPQRVPEPGSSSHSRRGRRDQHQPARVPLLNTGPPPVRPRAGPRPSLATGGINRIAADRRDDRLPRGQLPRGAVRASPRRAAAPASRPRPGRTPPGVLD